MSNFCFYAGTDPEVIQRLRAAAAACWGGIVDHSVPECALIVPDKDSSKSFGYADGVVGCIAGYARHDNASTLAEHNSAFLTAIALGDWPLGLKWTGSFAAMAYSEGTNEITLCNDILGHIPIYFGMWAGHLVGGTSLIVLGQAVRALPDPTGVLQRITTPHCNYGRRTLLEGISRLLPGERLKWRPGETEYRSDFDNTLVGDIEELTLQATARRVFDCMKNEVAAALLDADDIRVAMSGGMDSRLLLGSIETNGRKIECLTYGDDAHYESRIAARSARAIGASHRCFSIAGKYFPTHDQLEPLIRESESANYMEWFGMIEYLRAREAKKPLLLGDLCESIDGRYMTSLSTREARVRSFLKGIVGRRHKFTPSSDASFDEWASITTEKVVADLSVNFDHLSESVRQQKSSEQILAETRADIELSLERVRANMPPYVEMYDELFIWLHRIRFLLANQITWLGTCSEAISAGISVRFLRMITRVHPKFRVRKILMNRIIRLPEFDSLARIPSAQIPFISSRAPRLIRELIWGARSTADRLLITRAMKLRDADRRQRVLPSLDLVAEYRDRSSEASIRTWFAGRYVNAGKYLNLFRRRAELVAWPLINVDLAAPANVSTILDLACTQTEVQVSGSSYGK